MSACQTERILPLLDNILSVGEPIRDIEQSHQLFAMGDRRKQFASGFVLQSEDGVTFDTLLTGKGLEQFIQRDTDSY